MFTAISPVFAHLSLAVIRVCFLAHSLCVFLERVDALPALAPASSLRLRARLAKVVFAALVGALLGGLPSELLVAFAPPLAGWQPTFLTLVVGAAGVSAMMRKAIRFECGSRLSETTA